MAVGQERGSNKRELTAIRISPEDRAEIDQRASDAGMTRSAYMIAAALGKLGETSSGLAQRIELLERRLDRLERKGAP